MSLLDDLTNSIALKGIGAHSASKAAISHIHHEKCKYCSKTIEVVATHVGKTSTEQIFRCGHARIIKNVVADPGKLDVTFFDGAQPYPYQKEVVARTEKSNFRALWRLEQRLGKTVCALLALKAHPELLPVIIVCKASIKMQWFMEIMDRLDDIPQVINGGNELPVLDIVIISIDTLGRAKWVSDEAVTRKYKTIIIDECQSIKNHDAGRTNAFRKLCMRSQVVAREYTPNLPTRLRVQQMAQNLMDYHGVSGRFALNFEKLQQNKLGLCECYSDKDGIIRGTITIDKRHAENDKESDVLETILHEIAHAITPGAGHKDIWKDTSKAIGGDDNTFSSWCSGTEKVTEEFNKPLNIIALSGTPIKNHAGEYFPILNILHPELFPYRAPFIQDWCEWYSDAYGKKLGGIKKWRMEEFKRLTDPFIFNYTREQVAPDLPTINRQPLFVEIENKAVRKAYGEALEEFLDAEEDEDISTLSVIGRLAKLRHIVGFAKIIPIKEYVDEFMENFDGEKNLVVFVHHKDVGEHLKMKLEREGHRVLTFTSDLNGNQRFAVIQEFNKATGTILIASTGAAGEGVTIKNCNDIIIAERQWNPATEEQAEARSIHKETKDSKINVVYVTAIGTIDEMLASIVGRKRAAINSVLSGDTSIPWDADSILKELTAELRRKGKNAWKA